MPSGQFPTGTVTFLFTDIVGSTRLWEGDPNAMRGALVRHDALMRGAISSPGGYVFKTIGDAFCAAFATAPEAVNAALKAQLALLAEPWPEGVPIKVRMAMHTGSVECRDDDYFGPPVNRVARLLATAHGGQSLLSQPTYDLVRDSLPKNVSMRPLGEHRLKDLGRPETVYQLNHPCLLADFPPLLSLENPALRHNLPQQVTSFIGRETELADLKMLLAKSRLLTLTGSGGSGKTRLSLHVAADLIDGYRDGVWFVELAPVSDPNLVPGTVAEVLGQKEVPGRSPTQALLEHVEHKRLLLLLDNCEHLLEACAELANVLIRQCPGVRVLATSREALGIAGEQTYRVPSLAIPDLSLLQTPESLSQFDAVRLFIDRAMLVSSSFRVTNKNAPALASVCHGLDGIPLAIELAAARLRSLSLEEIDKRLDQRFRLLTGGSRTALPRHQTLRTLIDWSYDLLSAQEKLLLRRLSVFHGGWRLESAQPVCSGDEIEEWRVLDLLASLVDKSLVVYEEGEEAPRYRLLETLRQYARDRLLESGETEAANARHLIYFLGLANEAGPKLIGPGQAAWFRRLAEEHENFRAALEWSLSEPESTAALELCGSLWQFWYTRGIPSEGRVWCGRALAKHGSDARTRRRADALEGAGKLAAQQSDLGAARTYHDESLAIRQEIGDLHGVAGSLHNLGNVAHDLGDYVAALASHEESLAIRREIGDRHGMSASLNSKGNLAAFTGDYVAAREYHEESLAIRIEIGDRIGAAMSLGNLGNVAGAQGDYAAERALQEESLTIRREIGDRFGISFSLNNLGDVAGDQGDYTAARAFFEESLEIKREVGDSHGIAIGLHNLGNVAQELGDYAGARAFREESLTIRRDIGDRVGVAESLEAFASLACREGDAEFAGVMWGAAEAVREEIGAPVAKYDRARYDRDTTEARAALSEAAFSTAWAKGRGLTAEHAIKLALGKPIC